MQIFVLESDGYTTNKTNIKEHYNVVFSLTDASGGIKLPFTKQVEG